MNVLFGYYERKKRLASCPALPHILHDVQIHVVLSDDPVQMIKRHFIRNAEPSRKTSNSFGREIYSIVCPTVISSSIWTSGYAIVRAFDPSQARSRS